MHTFNRRRQEEEAKEGRRTRIDSRAEQAHIIYAL